MTTIITGFHYDLGGREVYEDRVRAETFVTPAGIELSVAAVADGVGGRDRGERAAQIALDTVFEVLQRSSRDDIPALLARAVVEANQAVYAEGQRFPARFQEASTTLAVAVVVEGTRLFIANVGDSRIYFCREGRLTQLTMDHTFSNLMPLRGILSWEAAAADKRAGIIMRAIGPRPQVQADIGFYVRTRDPAVAVKRGQKGIPLETGDTILVCSDGLIKEQKNGTPFVTDEEISRVLMSQEGDRAARSLVSFALGRDADDNVSAAVLQTPDPSRAERIEETERGRRRRQLLLTGGIVGIVVLLAAAAIGFFYRTGQETSALATVEAEALAEEQTRLFSTATAEVAEVTAVAVIDATRTAATLTAAPPTATFPPPGTPTSTPVADPADVQVAIAYIGAEERAVREREVVEAVEFPLLLQITQASRPAFRGATLYAFPGTQVQLGAVGEDRAQFTLFRGSELLVEAGDYAQGVELSLNPDTRISVFVVGSCLGVNYPDGGEALVLSCFGGICGYYIEAEQIMIPEGEQVSLDETGLLTATPVPIVVEAARRFEQLLRVEIGGDGAAVADACLAQY